MIKAIVFDCFGVLTTDVWLAFCDAQPAGADIEQASAINRAFDRGLMSAEQFVDRVTAVLGVPPPMLEDMKQGQMVLNRQLFDYILELKLHYKISILSNISDDWIKTTFLAPEEVKIFDDIMQSYEFDVIKPDPRIFELACQRLDVRPEEAVMIDDRIKNVDGAIAAGWHGILYTDVASLRRNLGNLLDTNQ